LASGLRHGIQKVLVPELAAGHAVAKLQGSALKNILDGGIKGMELRRKRVEFNVVWRVRRAVVEKWAMSLDQAVELPALEGNLLAQTTPHVATPLPA
jgi:hypothetical protein